MQEGERTLERRRQGAREQLEQIPQIYLTQSHKRSPILIIPHAENFSFEMVQLLLPSLKMFSFPAQESTNKVKKMKKKRKKKLNISGRRHTLFENHKKSQIVEKVEMRHFWVDDETLCDSSSCQRHAKSSSSYSFLQLEIILVFRCRRHRLKSALLQLVGEMHLSLQIPLLEDTKVSQLSLCQGRLCFCTQQQGDFMPKPFEKIPTHLQVLQLPDFFLSLRNLLQISKTVTYRVFR